MTRRTFFVAPSLCQRVALNNREVGQLARLDAAEVLLPPERLRRPERRPLNRLHRRNAHVGEHLHLVVQTQARNDLIAAAPGGVGRVNQ